MKIVTLAAPDFTSALAAARRRLGEETILLESRRLASGQVEVMVSAPRNERPEPSEVLAALLDAGLPDRLAASLSREVEAVPAASGPAWQRARWAVEKRLCPGTPIREGRRVVALVGPAGVGKTTTWAKLAARDALLNGLKVGLVTTDTMRIGGVEQARAYAAAMEVPFFIAGDPAAARNAAAATAQLDQVYVDTPGLSPLEQDEMEALSGLFGRLGVSGVDLLLPATGEIKGLKAALRRFAPLAPGRLGFTRLDEAAALGGMLTAALESGLPVAYLSRGPRVPDDLEDATPGRWLEEVLRPGAGGGVRPDERMMNQMGGHA